MELGTATFDDVALWCVARVVGRSEGKAVLDSGSKALGADRAAYSSGFGRLLDFPAATIVQLSEHHAVAELPDGCDLALGDLVRVVPNHVCNAVNLHDVLHPLVDGRWGQGGASSRAAASRAENRGPPLQRTDPPRWCNYRGSRLTGALATPY